MSMEANRSVNYREFFEGLRSATCTALKIQAQARMKIVREKLLEAIQAAAGAGFWEFRLDTFARQTSEEKSIPLDEIYRTIDTLLQDIVNSGTFIAVTNGCDPDDNSIWKMSWLSPEEVAEASAL